MDDVLGDLGVDGWVEVRDVDAGDAADKAPSWRISSFVSDPLSPKHNGIRCLVLQGPSPQQELPSDMSGASSIFDLLTASKASCAALRFVPLKPGIASKVRAPRYHFDGGGQPCLFTLVCCLIFLSIIRGFLDSAMHGLFILHRPPLHHLPIHNQATCRWLSRQLVSITNIM